MNEVEKMYENAGISKEVIPCPAKYYGYDCTRNNWDDADCSCDIEEYPLFTAEKQIAILKLLTQQCDLTISHFTKWEFIHYDYVQEPLQVTGKDFTETFIKLINAYWENLTDKEKEQIREILK